MGRGPVSSRVFPLTPVSTRCALSARTLSRETASSLAIYFIFFFGAQGKNHPVIPFAVMSGFAFIAGCLCALLPETLGKPTPETFIEDISETNYQHNLNANEQPLSCTSLESDSR